MLRLSRFLRAITPISAVLAAGATVILSSHAASAKTFDFSFGAKTSTKKAQTAFPTTDAFVRVGLPTQSPQPTEQFRGGFSTLLGPTKPATNGWKLAASDPAIFAFSQPNYTVNEGDGKITLTVVRSGNLGIRAAVQYQTNNGIATQPQDYQQAGGVLNFAPNEIRKTIDVSINNDNIKESSETFTVSLSNATANDVSNTAQIAAPSTATVSIIDDDAIIQFDNDNISVNEGDRVVNLTLNRDAGDVSKAATVQYTTANGTATAGEDYTARTGTATFAAGSSTATISVPIIDDTQDENDETFTVTLSGPSPTGNNTLGTKTTETITIVDNDTTNVSLSLPTYSVDEGTGNAVVTVVRSGDVSRALSVDYTTSDGTAQGAFDDSKDYQSVSGTLSFNPGQATNTISIPITDDALAENNETFTIALSNVVVDGTTASITPYASATITIVDNDAQFNFTARTYSIGESAGKIVITVTRNTNFNLPASVDYTTSDITATAGNDYTTTSGTLSFVSGDRQKTIEIPILPDTTDEDNETFSISLSNPSDGTQLGPTSVATITILDDDAVPSITVADVSTLEGNITDGATQQVFTAKLSAVSSRTITFRYATADGTARAGSDYVATSGTVVFPPNTLTRTFAVRIIDDAVYENDEGYIVNLSDPTNSTLTINKVVGTIRNDDAAPLSQFSFVSPTASTSEDNANIQIQVTRDGSTTTAASVVLTTSDGTATAGEDYGATTQTLQFPIGTKTVTATIPVLDDSLSEATETFTASLSNATNPGGEAKIDQDKATETISIADNDPLPTLTIASVKQAEGDSGTTPFSFTVQLNTESAQTISVNYATADGSATAGNDYKAVSGTLTFAPGETSKTITVPVNGDTNTEPTETFTVNLSAPVNVTLGASRAVGTITNDDTPIVISNLAFAPNSLNPTVNENAGKVTLTVTRAQGLDRPATVQYTTSNGTALAGSDYTTTSGTLTFAVGQRTAAIVVPILDDTIKEDTETFKVTLSKQSSNAALPAENTATVTIRDNEGTPTLSIANAQVQEGNSGRTSLVFTVSLQPQSQSKVTVVATAQDGTASSAAGKGQDYISKSDTLTFNPGESTKTFSLTVISDAIVESDETVNVTLSQASGAPIRQARAVGTIINDDQPGGGGTISFLTPSYSIDEGAGVATITIARSGNVDMLNQQTASVRVTSGQGTATPNQDYKPINSVITFAKGETVKSFNVAIINNNAFENDETVPLTLSEPSDNAILGTTTRATLTITDDDSMSSIPRADSLTPTNPTGSKFVVTTTYSSDYGATDLSPVIIQVGGNINGGGFRAVYDQRTNRLSLDPTAGATSNPKTNRFLINQYGVLDCSGTTVQRSGNTLTVTWSIRLDSSFTKAQPIYLGAVGSTGESVFVRRGTWNPGSTTNAFNSANGS